MGGEKVPEYKARLTRLENFVMIKWRDDTTIIPRESSHFEFYHHGQDQLIMPLGDSPIYREDWIGLKTLDDATRLHFYTIPGDHMALNQSWIAETIVPFLF